MRHIRAMRRVVGLTVVAATAVMAVAGCGVGAAGADGAGGADGESTTALAPEGMALAALGYDPYDLAVADPEADTEQYADRGRRGWGRRGHGPRGVLRENMLHGEMVVETADGTPQTMLVQRGEVTESTDTEVTVTSTDGFAQTWTYDEDLRVVESRDPAGIEDLTVGAEIGVAGHEDGAPVAGLIVITDR